MGVETSTETWYKKFDSFMGEHGYGKTTSDHCVFVKKFPYIDFIIFLLYAGDINCRPER